jgi:hypothetical protein
MKAGISILLMADGTGQRFLLPTLRGAAARSTSGQLTRVVNL